MFDQLHLAALLGAHLLAPPKEGFRPALVRFLFDLFWNWVSSVQGRAELENLHLTQTTRLLKKLKADAWVISHKNKFSLSNAGVLGILQILREAAISDDARLTDFYIYFVKAYGHRLAELKAKDESNLPLALKHELTELLDLKPLLISKRQRLKQEIEYWRTRIAETKRTIAFARAERSSGVEWSDIVKRLDQFFPYELKGQKPLPDLFKNMPADWQEWEILEGNSLRMNLLWHNRILELEAQVIALEKMRC